MEKLPLFKAEFRGIIPIYKPKGPTSFDMIARLRRITGEKKIGHAGTLDPLASGVLVVGIGREATRKINLELVKEKEYKATICLGITSTTDDEEGEKTVKDSAPIPSKDTLESVLPQFLGSILQTPPIFSAIKQHGKPVYKAARKGQTVVLEPRTVLVKSINIDSYAYPELVLSITTGPGVYIRSIARDLGEKLGSGAYLSDLVRTRVGEYTLKDALHLETN